MRGQRDAGLTVAAARIPGLLTRFTVLREPCKQGIGIARPGAGVMRGVAGKVIVERSHAPTRYSASLRHSPGCRPSRRYGPIAIRTRRRVGQPTAALIRRTSRLRPSRMVISMKRSAKRRGGEEWVQK